MKNQSLRPQRNREKLLVYNSITSLVGQIASVICGFVLTRLILGRYGSETNGLVASITQFLGFISFLELGIGAVVKSALYKPLAEGDYQEASRIIISTKRFYRKIAYILIAYTAVLAVAFPLITAEEYDFWFTASLVVIISLSLFAQFFFGMPYQLFLNADQRTYITTGVTCATLLLNTALSALLIFLGASIQTVKLMTSAVYIIRPAVYILYVRKRYPLDETIPLNEEPLKQKWNGMAQHLAYVVVNYTDIVVLTLLSTLSNVSIYTVYHNVTIGVQQIISSVSVGISAMLGNVLYSENKRELQKTFGLVEWFFHFVTTLFFTLTGLLIVPFVQVYTQGVTDANYTAPLFAFLITLAQASYSIRTPYETMVLAANHFKQTQRSAWIEMIINIALSVVLVGRYGLIGVAIGTFCAMLYRTLYFVWYLRKNVLDYQTGVFFKHILLDVAQALLCFGAVRLLGVPEAFSQWGQWLLYAVEVGVICCVLCGGVQLLFNRTYLFSTLNRFLKRGGEKTAS